MVTSRDNIQSDNLCGSPSPDGSPQPIVDETALALARLLGRQAAREAFRAARAEATASDLASPAPATRTDEE